MKKSIYLFAAALCLTLSACGQTTMPSSNSGNNASSSVSSSTVTYYDTDGKTVLKTETVSTAKEALKYTPKKEGKTFVGWYLRPDFSRKFTGNSNLASKVSLYAGFSTYKEDTRKFAIVGNGNSPVLKASNWGAVINDEHKLTKENKTDSNIYTITVTLEKGDEFQFAINGSWANQRGFGYLENPKKDGVTYFESSGGLGEVSSKRSNIKVAKSGTYTFTLKTHPAEDSYDTKDSKYTEANKESFNVNNFDTITWKYNG